MSGFNRKTGRYELTLTKGLWWSRFRDPRPESMDDLAALLVAAGMKFERHPRWLDVDAAEGQIFDAIHGPWRG